MATRANGRLANKHANEAKCSAKGSRRVIRMMEPFLSPGTSQHRFDHQRAQALTGGAVARRLVSPRNRTRCKIASLASARVVSVSHSDGSPNSLPCKLSTLPILRRTTTLGEGIGLVSLHFIYITRYLNVKFSALLPARAIFTGIGDLGVSLYRHFLTCVPL